MEREPNILRGAIIAICMVFLWFTATVGIHAIATGNWTAARCCEPNIAEDEYLDFNGDVVHVDEIKADE